MADYLWLRDKKMKEEDIQVNNEVKATSVGELAEELQAMRFAFAVLFTQLSPDVKNGILFQLNEAQPDAAKRLGGFLSQFKDIN